MKKAAGLIFMIVLVVGGSFVLRGMLPIMPVFGTSMEPTLKAGNIVTVEEVSPSDVKVGDIIVFEVPSAVREYYNYPPIVAHRVLEVNDNAGFLTFRTKGDNTGEEPFAVRAHDLRGRVGQQIPYVGFPLLFLQSQQGLIFMIVAICGLGLYLYREEIGRSKRRVQEGVFAPVIEESRRSGQVLEQRAEGTQQALEKFASAMEEYAGHLRSHTSAIKGLSEASQELKVGAAEQNKVLSRLTEIMGHTVPRSERVASNLERAVAEQREIQERLTGAREKVPPEQQPVETGYGVPSEGKPTPPIPTETGYGVPSEGKPTSPIPMEARYGVPSENEAAPSIEELIVQVEKPKRRWATGLEYEDWLEW